MSLIGIDLGTSAIKVVAYAADGASLAMAHETMPAYQPEPGHFEVDVVESRDAFRRALSAVAANPALRADPPLAISFSSSGREVFPVAEDGTPLGPCLMTPDTRGDDDCCADRCPPIGRGLVQAGRPRAAAHGSSQPSAVVAQDQPGRGRGHALVHELARVLLRSCSPVVRSSTGATRERGQRTTLPRRPGRRSASPKPASSRAGCPTSRSTARRSAGSCPRWRAQWACRRRRSSSPARTTTSRRRLARRPSIQAWCR